VTDLDEARARAREYFRTHGTGAPVAVIRERVGAAFAALESLLAPVDAARAARRAAPEEWSVHEIVDHLVETHRASLDELWCLLAGRRPPGEPIPAGLQSRSPLDRPWPWLVRELKTLHADVGAALASVRDAHAPAARAAIVMVVNVERDGRREPLHWVEEVDWKTYAIVFRLHTQDHLGQARRVLGALRAPAAPA
jgi:hypothetical protein